KANLDLLKYYDLVFTTVDFKTDLDVPIFRVNALFNEESIKKEIENAILLKNSINLKSIKKIEKNIPFIGKLIEEDKFFILNKSTFMENLEDMLEKWTTNYNFSLEIIKKACDICFQRLNRADFKYIDGILSSWNKDNLRTLKEIEEKEVSYKNSSSKKNFNNQKSNSYEKPKLRFNNFKGRDYDYDDLEKKLLGWDNDD
ncbi:MAG: DnaD domain protein, partial [Clostridium sp.]|nr:DnaD domain protein [Clostridium sp.]